MIVAGPWVGEFGWELFCWQAFLRTISQTEKILIVSRKNSKALYEDFATNFIGLDTPPGIADCAEFRSVLPEMWAEEQIKPSNSFFYWHNNPVVFPEFGSVNPDFILYGKHKKNLRYDLIISSRMRQLVPERNWPYWNTLVERLPNLKIAVIGTNAEAQYVEGADDLRDQPLDFIMDVLASSKMVVGPSSGPMHLAGLCTCPRLVLNGMPPDHIRYTDYWNPFKTETTIINDWRPTVDEVVERIKEIIGT